MNFRVRFNDIWQRTGRLEKPHNLAASSFKPAVVRGNPYGLILYWPQELSWLSVTATAEVSGSEPIKFLAGQEGLDSVYKGFNKDFASEIPVDLLQTQNFLAAQVPHGAAMRFEFAIDTDDEEFCGLAADWIKSLDSPTPGKAEPGTQQRQVRTYMEQVIVTYALDGRDSETGEIALTLEPVTVPEYYDGYVAIDFGTTTTALACLPHGRRELEDLKVLCTTGVRVDGFGANPNIRGQLLAEAPPTETRFKLDAVDGQLDDHPGSARWRIGQQADDTAEGLVLGPKRLGASPFWKDPLLVFAYNTLRPTRRDRVQPLEIQLRHPAELFICRIFQKFCEATSTRPMNLAITYPTTYSSRELQQIKDIVIRAWLRMRVKPQTEENIRQVSMLTRSGVAGRQPFGKLLLALDEATAASFCFLYEKISAPGGLPRFKYLYPQGLNLLLFDCGGGTTDVALVHARLADDVPNKLAVSVRARSGLRSFGGDNITAAVFTVLKAKIAFALWQSTVVLAKMQANAPIFPKQATDRAKLANLLKDHAAAIDRLVPTRFAPDGQDEDNKRNRALTLFLWERAEELKRKLNAASGSAQIPSLSNQAPMFELARRQGIKNDDVASLLSDIRVHRWEVDTLIEEPLQRGIRNCNNLIRRRLTEAGEEVHWLVAAGNASLYPLIKEQLLKLLDVQFKEERFTLDERNLKYAVAKGAALALGAQEMGTLPIRFDSDLSEKLPFDIAYWDGVKGVYCILFAEGKRYVDLTKQTVNFGATVAATDAAGQPLAPAAEPGDDQAAHKWFILYRRWPGDEDEFEIFGRYHFPNEVQMPVTISYDGDRGDFIVEDAAGTGRLKPDSEDMKPYRSPPERGDL